LGLWDSNGACRNSGIACYGLLACYGLHRWNGLARYEKSEERGVQREEVAGNDRDRKKKQTLFFEQRSSHQRKTLEKPGCSSVVRAGLEPATHGFPKCQQGIFFLLKNRQDCGNRNTTFVAPMSTRRVQLQKYGILSSSTLRALTNQELAKK
jgi:hypothetical protein